MVDPETGTVQNLTGVIAFQWLGSNVASLSYDPVARVAVGYALTSRTTVRIITFSLATGTLTFLEQPPFINPIAVALATAAVPLLHPILLTALAAVLCVIAIARLQGRL